MPLKSVATVIGLPPPCARWRCSRGAGSGRAEGPGSAAWPGAPEPRPGSGPAVAARSQLQSAALRLQTTQRAA
eukprot:5928148-Alexandrium_andersonii.AAC.1